MNRYQRGKARAREKAIFYQLNFYEHEYSWYELIEWQEYFCKLARRYGLVKEFRENAII